MKMSNAQVMLLTTSLMLVAATTSMAQTTANAKKNNPYSPSPLGKINQPVPATIKTNATGAVFILQNQNGPFIEDKQTAAQETVVISKTVESRSLPPSEIYKVAIGDVLFVNLRNSAQGSRYCTVQLNGTIDYPLAGENLIVADKTVDDIEEMLSSGITLFSDPQIEVKIREYGSHKITVSGMIENPGEKSLQREAMPLYALRSEAVVSATATRVVIKRAPLLKLESYDLNDAATDNVLIYPGNSIEFTSDTPSSGGSYYIAGEVKLSGQKEITSGITLYQAVIASGGTNGDPKKATIRRKNDKGLFASTEYNLRSIKEGRSADPALESGDVIEIRK